MSSDERATAPHGPVLVLGEGLDEVNFFTELCEAHELAGIDLRSYGGRDLLRGELAALRALQLDSIASIVIVRDADDSAAAAFASVRDALSDHGFAVPDRHGGLAGETPSTAIWLMPDGKSPGTLETLCWQAAAGDPVAACVEEYVACTERHRVLPEDARHKAHARAWLSTRTRAETRIGLAAQLASRAARLMLAHPRPNAARRACVRPVRLRPLRTAAPAPRSGSSPARRGPSRGCGSGS